MTLLSYLADGCRRSIGIVAALAIVAGTMNMPAAQAAHGVALQGNGKLVMLDEKGEITWSIPWDGVHDIHVLPNGNVMVQQGEQR